MLTVPDDVEQLRRPITRREYELMLQMAFAASDGSEPEPDLAVVERRDYDVAHPAHAFSIVEVASSSLAIDRGAKACLYAESGVAEYWVVDVAGRRVEVRRVPVDGRYGSVTTHARGEAIRIEALGVELEVSEFVR